MKRLMLILALFAGFSLLADDAQARHGRRARVVARHAIHHHHRPVVRYYAPPVYVHPRVYHHRHYVPYYHHHGVGGVYYQSPGISIGIRF